MPSSDGQSAARVAALIKGRRRLDLAFAIAGALLVVCCLGTLGLLVYNLVHDGATRLSWNFLSSFPSRHPGKAGILSALVGTGLVMLVTSLIAIPLGVAAGIYLEEYARKNVVTNIIEINIANLAGVPSIIWGLMALGIFIYGFEDWFGTPKDTITGLGRSILTGGLTLGLLVLPIVIVSTREAIRSIPQSIREGSYACGATKLQTVVHHIFPYSLGGVLTGSIIALSRAIGETAPLITIGALTYIAYLPPAPFSRVYDTAGKGVGGHGMTDWLFSGFTVLPIQMFNWLSQPNRDFQVNAAATGVVLLVVTLMMNFVAIVLRNRLRRRIQW
jgi:phosphate transport system permease protein